MSIPDFGRCVAGLQTKLNDVLAGGRRTKCVAAGINLEWPADEKAEFEHLKQAIKSSAELKFPSDDAQVCLFTDASELGWGIVVTQVHAWNSDVLAHEQDHELLAC